MMAEPIFSRGISDNNLGQLWELTKASAPNWWTDVLTFNEGAPLILALRNERVDVYHRGCLIYKIEFPNKSLKKSTHVKYLIREPVKGNEYISLEENKYSYTSEAMQSGYHGKETLSGIVKAAEYYAGNEQRGIHRAIAHDSNWLDVEVSFQRSEDELEASVVPSDQTEGFQNSASKTAVKKTLHDRVDVVVLGNKSKRNSLVFWEAKHFSNQDIFGEKPKVIQQMERYRKQIAARKDEIVRAYEAACRFQQLEVFG